MDDDTDDGWDLHAVVRGCTAPPLPARPNPTLSPPDSSFDFLNYNQNNNNYNNSHTGGGTFQDLQDAYREFCGELPSANPAPTGPGLNVFQPPAQEIMQILRMNNINNGSSQENIQFNNNNNPSRINGASSSWSSSPSHNLQPTNPQPIRQRRRKNNQMRIVRHMTQEELSADSWAWRKYGQKPIKGSPFPRNYYRCNTSKGCAARKQVERSSSVDPGVFVVSYTGEHTHSRPNHHRTSGSILAKSSTGGAGTSSNNNNNKLMYRSSSGRFSHGGTGNDDVDMGGEDEEEEDENLYMISNGDDDDDMFYKGFHDSDHDHSSGGGGCGNFYTVPNTGNAHRLRG